MTNEKLQAHFKDIVDQGRMSTFQMMIVAVCFILNMNDGIDVLIVSFSSVEIIKEWGLSKADMGYVFSMGLFGMMLGSFFVAPLSDKFGRKKIFIACLSMISIGMLVVSVCTSYSQLLGFRFLTGMGIGGILPSLAATAAEFSNHKHRDFNVGLVQAGWPVGSILTGFFCAFAIPHFGWRFTFLIAGCVSSFMLLLVVFFMEDSLDYLLKRQPHNAIKKINYILKKMHQPALTELPSATQIRIAGSFKTIIGLSYSHLTYKLWVAVFFGFLTLYTLLSWVPTIAKDSGLPFHLATYVGIILNVGAAIGTTSLGWVARKFGLKKTVFSYLLFAFFVMLIYGNSFLTTALIFSIIFFIGIFVQGGFNGMYAIMSRVYSTEIRATGVGYAVGVGRLGAIIGPALFGVLSDGGMSISLLFTLFSIPLLITGIVVLTLNSKNLNY